MSDDMTNDVLPDDSDAVLTDVMDDVMDDVVDCDSQLPQGMPCSACGAPVEAHDHFCVSCGQTIAAAPEPVIAAEPVSELPFDANVEETAAAKGFRCENCGSEVTTTVEQRSYVCPFCDSAYVVEFSPADSQRQRPEFVIGFSITDEQARSRFRQWLGQNSWFRPGDLHAAKVVDRLKGVYLPFWSFSMLAESRWSAQIGEYWYRTETYTTTDSKGNTVTRTRTVTETEWWPLSGKFHQYRSGYLVSGSRGLSQQDADRIKPFQMPALKRYEPYYLAGWMSEEYSVDADEALVRCKQVFHNRQEKAITAFLPGNTNRSLQAQTQFRDIISDLCLLPIYVLSYRYKDKVYRFLLNGQTGKADGDKPISVARIAAAVVGVLVAAAVVIGIGWLMSAL